MEKSILIKELQSVIDKLENKQENIVKNYRNDISLNIATKDLSPVFMLNKRNLYTEGKVEFELNRFIATICKNKYELRLILKYQIGNYTPIYEYYTVEHDKESLKSDYLIREIVMKMSDILGKDTITKEDFKQFIGSATIVTEVDNEGIPYSKFTNINLEKIDIDINKNNKPVLEKEFDELTKDDISKIVEAFGLDSNSPMYKDKLEEIGYFCSQNVERDNFSYIGKTFMKLEADLVVDLDATPDDIYKYVLEKLKFFNIKPSCIWISEGCCCLEYFPNKYFHFKHWSDYLRLIIDFIEHIESINIEGVKIRYKVSDEQTIRYIDNNSPILSDVKFTKELFDEKEKIEFYGEYVDFVDVEAIK